MDSAAPSTGEIAALPATLSRAGLKLRYSSQATVPVRDLHPPKTPWVRGVDAKYVQYLAEIQEELPPVFVQRHTMRVIDGMHRWHAAISRGTDSIEVRFVDCADTDAFLLAVLANVSHGMPLSLADRKAAAARVLRTHPHWSDRAIARVVGLSHKTVGALRSRPSGNFPQLDNRVGRDGRTRRVTLSAARETAAELMTAMPSASLREIGRLAGISPETARAVRTRLGQPTRAPAAPAERRRLSQEQWETLTRKLRRDPSLRYSEAGRTLLQMMDLQRSQWRRMAEAVPTHCAEIVAALAADCASRWAELAQQLVKNTESA